MGIDPATAIITGSAGGNARDDDVVAGLERGDGVSDLVDDADADALVAERSSSARARSENRSSCAMASSTGIMC